jgi:hypothetical protein
MDKEVLSRDNRKNDKVLTVSVGLLIVGAATIGLSVLLPKQFTSCTGTVCTNYYVSGFSTCSKEVQPSQGEAICDSAPSFWQLTQFWLFDLGIVGLALVLISAPVTLVNANRSKRHNATASVVDKDGVRQLSFDSYL